MKGGFRQSMAWLHTWTGLLLGWLLFAIFVTGTSAYFQEEITRWMTPEVRSVPADPASGFVAATEWLKANADAATAWLDGVTTFDGSDAQAALKAHLGM